MVIFFWLLAFLALGSALGVVLCRNPVYSALYLILNLFLVAAFYAMMDAHFLAVAQIIVYAGAIMVLVLFVIMLLGLKPINTPRPILVTTIGIGSGIWFLSVILPIIAISVPDSLPGVTPVIGGVREVGRLLYGKYVFAFEAASILIIAAIAGAVALAKKRKIEEVR